MKKILFFIVGLIICLGILGQSEKPRQMLYSDLGVITINKEGGTVSIGGYITIQKEYLQNQIQNSIQEVKQEVYNKKKYERELEPEIWYSYDIYFVSRSIHVTDTTSTWVHGLKIFADGEQLLSNQFPDGFMISIKTQPTLVYSYQSKSDSVSFNIEWDKLIYEPRIRK